MNVVLWILQILLALLFIFAGGAKFVMTAESMKAAAPDAIQFPMWFVKFIGVFEVLGGLGLVLPGLTGIRRSLTPLAAAGLLIIMLGAVAVSVYAMGISAGVIPFVSAVLLAFIAYGRRDWK